LKRQNFFEPTASYPYYLTKSNYRNSSQRVTWQWEDLGGVIIDAPAVTSKHMNNLEVFGRGTDNHLWHKYRNGSSWSDWEDLGGTLSAGPAAVSRAENLIDCVVRGMDGHVYHKSFDRYGWSD